MWCNTAIQIAASNTLSRTPRALLSCCATPPPRSPAMPNKGPEVSVPSTKPPRLATASKYFPFPHPLSSTRLPCSRESRNCTTEGHGECRVAEKCSAARSYTENTWAAVSDGPRQVMSSAVNVVQPGGAWSEDTSLSSCHGSTGGPVGRPTSRLPTTRTARPQADSSGRCAARASPHGSHLHAAQASSSPPHQYGTSASRTTPSSRVGWRMGTGPPSASRNSEGE
mmetsp:Transcript_117236/g.269252  ORF Transcript_117236/g.269252 Transcript_117236/m.269252 type:complete len:225 (-) Transcript_117236:324-998(-)